MATPSQLIRMAQERRRMKRRGQGIKSAPIREAEFMPPPMPTSHANYTKLMRSHDRMGSRHLSKSGN